MWSSLRKLLVVACLLGGAVWAGQSAALADPTPTGPVQPGTAPVAGVTYTSSGNIGEAGGLTYSFSGLSSAVMAQFSDLEWGPADSSAVQLSLDGNASFSEPGQTMSFNAGDSDLAAGAAVWTGTTQYPIAQPSETLTLDTMFIMTASTSLNATSGYGDGATVPVTGNFSANLIFEVSADGGTTWTPALTYYNAQQNVIGNTIQSSFQGGFFYVLSGVPVASISPSSPFDFGNQVVGQTSAAQVFTVQNTGNADLNMVSAAASGDFAISSDECSGTSVAPGGMCTISVTFTPTQTGSLGGTLTITDNAADSPQQISLSGTGTQPLLSLSSSSLTFGDQAVGSTSAAQTVTITNNGTSDLHVASVSTSGTNAGDFSASPSGCGDVPATETCTISVTFTPSASGARSATLDIVSDSPTSPDQVSLSGTGINPELALSPNPMNFGTVLVGQPSTLALTLLNAGTDPTYLTGPPTSGGADPDDFAIVRSSVTCPSNSSGTYIPAGGSCSVNITFTPAAVGTRSATLTFPNDSVDGPQQLTLSGNGTVNVPTTTTVSSSVNPSVTIQGVTYTATITPAPGTGTVSFTDNGSPIAGCSAVPVSGAAATCSVPPLTAGGHNIVATFSGATGFSGSTSATMTQVVTTSVCATLAGCDLESLNLTNANLADADLAKADLKKADLVGANLAGADLTSAALNKADLAGANLSGADLTSATLNSADLAGANLSNADLTKADLSDADLNGANLTGATLSKAKWSDTTCPDGTNSDDDGDTCVGHL
jgi:hypothetical protein